MIRKKRDIGTEIIEDLKDLHATLQTGTPLQEKYLVRRVRTVPRPRDYAASDVRKTRALVGVSQLVFAQMLGVSVSSLRSWETGQRTPTPIARRLLDLIRDNPSSWRAMIEAA